MNTDRIPLNYPSRAAAITIYDMFARQNKLDQFFDTNELEKLYDTVDTIWKEDNLQPELSVYTGAEINELMVLLKSKRSSDNSLLTQEQIEGVIQTLIPVQKNVGYFRNTEDGKLELVDGKGCTTEIVPSKVGDPVEFIIGENR